MPSSSRASGRRARGAICSVATTREHILTPTKGARMPFEVPDLPYAYDALEPHIDAETMRIHHDLHHKAYVDNANAALAGTELADRPIENVLTNIEVLPEDKQKAVRNNAGGHANHSLFWTIMGPNGGGGPAR